jgi:hypothetical protein
MILGNDIHYYFFAAFRLEVLFNVVKAGDTCLQLLVCVRIRSPISARCGDWRSPLLRFCLWLPLLSLGFFLLLLSIKGRGLPPRKRLADRRSKMYACKSSEYQHTGATARTKLTHTLGLFLLVQLKAVSPHELNPSPTNGVLHWHGRPGV